MAIISISRQFGAGGKTLAERLATRLGYQFVEDELLSLVAKAANVSVETVEEAGRRSQSAFSRFVTGLSSTNYLYGLLGQARPDFQDTDLFALLENIIPSLASRGNVIFLGRGSQFILPNHPLTLKVLLVADEEHRIRFLMDNYQLPMDRAREVVTDWDRNRRDFLARFTSGEPNDVSLYDITLNTAAIRLSCAEDLICNLIASREGQPREA